MYFSEALEARALQKKSAFTPESSVLEKRETSIVKAGAWASRAKWDWVLKKNQYGDGVDTQNACVFKLDTK